jgi:maltooligosyltrehalose trehalohydrolase
VAARREFPKGDADAIAFDEDAKWLVVTRGGFELVCNFSDRVVEVPVTRTQTVVASHAARIEDGAVVLEPLSGALLR